MLPKPEDMLINIEPEPKLNKGFFSLQMHAGDSGQVLFRNIKVKELWYSIFPENTSGGGTDIH